MALLCALATHAQNTITGSLPPASLRNQTTCSHGIIKNVKIKKQMKVKSWRSSGTSGLCVTPFINFTCPQRWRLFPVKQVHPMKCLNFHTTEHVQCAACIKPHLWIYSFFILKQEKENRQIVPTVKNCRNSSKDFTLRRHLNVKRGLLVYISVWEKNFQNVVIGPWLNSPTPFLFQKKKKKSNYILIEWWKKDLFRIT